MKDRFPLRILEQDGRYKATTSVIDLQSRSRRIRQDMGYIEFDYSVTVRAIQDIRGTVQENKVKKADPRAFWLIGDILLAFLHRIDNLGFYLVNQNRVLGEGIGMSESSIKRIIAFRKRFPDIARVNPTISWSKYRENKVPY